MYQNKNNNTKAIKTHRQMAVYNGKLRKPERMNRENLKKKKKGITWTEILKGSFIMLFTNNRSHSSPTFNFAVFMNAFG